MTRVRYFMYGCKVRNTLFSKENVTGGGGGGGGKKGGQDGFISDR